MSDPLFKKPDGSFVRVAPQYAEAAARKGYVLSDETQLEASRQTGRAFLEGAARGATLGISDQMLVGWGVKPAEMKARKEENPLAAGGGELAGALGTSIATGGGASALVGGGIKGAAFEGGLYGMGSMVSEAALENRDVATDSLASGFLGGALASGGVAAAFKGVGKGVSLGMSKFGGKGMKEALSTAADDIEWKALTRGMPDSWVKRNEAFKADILRKGREAKMLGTASSAFDQEGLAKGLLLKQDTGAEVGKQLDLLETFVPLKSSPELRAEFSDFIEKRLASKFKNSPAYEDALKETRKYIDSIREVSRPWRGMWDDVQATLFKDADPTKTASAEVREEMRQAIRDFTFDEVASGKNKAGKVLTASPDSWVKPKIKLKLGEAVSTWAPEPYRPEGFVPRATARPVTVNLDEGGAAGGVFDAPVSMDAPPVTNPEFAAGAFQRTPDLYYLPGQAQSRSLTVRLGEPEQLPGGVFTDASGSRFVSSAGEVPRFQLPAPEFDPRTVTLGEDPVRGGLNISPDPITVRLGDEPVSAGGMTFDLPAKVSPEWLGAKMRQTGREYAATSALVSAFEKRVRSLDKSSLFGIESIGAGALGGALTGNPLGAVAASLAKRQVERRGALLSASALRAIADSSVSKGVSSNLQKHLNTVLNTAPELLGAYRYPLAVAAAQGADALAQEHLRLASSDVGQDYLARTGLPAETPEEVDAAGAKLAVLDAIDQQARAHQADLDSAVDGLFGSAPGRKAGVSAPMTPKEFSKAFAQIQSFIQSPETAFEQIPPEMRAAAPAATGEAVQKMLMAAQFLYSKAPKSPYAGMPAAIAPKWEPDAVSLDRFYRYKEAVEQPARVLKNMSQGYISPEQVEALKAVYPSMYAELQQKIGERLMTLKSPPTYQQRLAFSALLGPGALGMSPQQVQILQQTQGLASQAQRGQGGGVKPPDGRQDVNEDQMETEAQKLEAR